MTGWRLGRPMLLLLVAFALVGPARGGPPGSKPSKCQCEICGVKNGHKSFVNGRVISSDAGPKPYPPKGDAHVRNETKIHMLISAFRDPRCGQTLANAYLRARHPERVYVGVVQQNLPDKDKFDCFAVYCSLMKREGFTHCPYLDNLEIVRVDAKNAKGPIWARAMGAVMVKQDQEFCMQVDAHVDFMQHYDVALMRMWAMTENEYGVLSTYVGNVKQDLSRSGHVLIGHPHYEIPFICKTIVGAHGVVRNAQATGAYCLPKPHLSFTWAAGWSFSKCHFERNVPNDPFLEGMFDGEEFSRALRGWTHGYDIYTPHRPVVFHDYTHFRPWQQGRESTWNANPPGLKYALKRYNSLVERQGHSDYVDLGYYGLGTERTIDQYIAFSGINPRTSKQEGPNKCGVLKFVPFVESPDKVNMPMPEFPIPLPGVRASGRDPIPHSEAIFVQYAHEMIDNEKNEEPSIPHERQLQEFGVPPARIWKNLMKKVISAQARARARSSVGGLVDRGIAVTRSGSTVAQVGMAGAAVTAVVFALFVLKRVYSMLVRSTKND